MTDSEVAQWFLDLDPIASGFNCVILVESMGAAKRQLDEAIACKQPAEKVQAAYEKIGGALGATVFTVLLESDDAFPEVNHSGKPTPPSPGKVTLYVDPAGKRLLVEATKQWGMHPKFSVA
jgi:hypothetical protein